MLPSEMLELMDALTRIDPLRTFEGRGLDALARFAQAHSAKLEPAAEATREVVEKIDGQVRVQLPLRVGKRCFGALLLELRPERYMPDLRLVRFGARIFSRQLDFVRRLAPPSGDGPASLAEVRNALDRSPLTPRERDVVSHLLAGASTRQIAARTGLTVATVHTYLKRVYPKLGVHSRVELLAQLVGTKPVLRNS